MERLRHHLHCVSCGLFGWRCRRRDYTSWMRLIDNRTVQLPEFHSWMVSQIKARQ